MMVGVCPAGSRARKNSVSNRTGANTGVCQRPANVSVSGASRQPCSRATCASVAAPERSAVRAAASAATSTGPSCATSTPVSSSASRTAHTRAPRSKSSGTAGTANAASAASTFPPGNAMNPGWNGTASLRRTQNTSRSRPSPRTSTTHAASRNLAGAFMRPATLPPAGRAAHAAGARPRYFPARFLQARASLAFPRASCSAASAAAGWRPRPKRRWSRRSGPELLPRACLLRHLDELLHRHRARDVGDHVQRQVVERLEADAGLAHVELLPRRLEARGQLLLHGTFCVAAHEIERHVVLLASDRGVAQRLAVVRVGIDREGHVPRDHPPGERLLVALGQVLVDELPEFHERCAAVFGEPLEILGHGTGVILLHGEAPRAGEWRNESSRTAPSA